MSSSKNGKNSKSVNAQSKIRTEQIAALGEKGTTKPSDWRWFEIPSNRAFSGLFDSLFPLIEDWALEDEWEPQTVAEFIESERWEVSKSRKTIFIQPLSFDDAPHLPSQPTLEQLVDFTSSYFGLPVKLLPPLNFIIEGGKRVFIEKSQIKTSPNEFGDKRVNVLSVMDYLYENIPPTAYCVLAITNWDIYEVAKDANPIMGRGSGDRVGLLSLYRFNPLLHLKSKPSRTSNKKKGDSITETTEEVQKSEEIEKLNSRWLLPACKTLAHESMHMFGLDHCTHFMCVMNANVSPWDDGKDPIHLCPVCLRKLHLSTKFDISKRFEELLRCYERFEWTQESDFVKKRIALAESTKSIAID